jgi:LysR family hydrogen peroxide-inducible transcriptional activator
MNLCSLNKKMMASNLSFKPNSLDTLINMVEHMDGLTLIPELFFNDLSESQKKKVKDFTNPFPVREISLLYNRPYAKLRLIETLSKEIQQLIRPVLSTNGIDKDEMNVLAI